ncbi:MAG: hypothetical protein AB7F19_03660 [Candidatus Babeliales bacterium]
MLVSSSRSYATKRSKKDSPKIDYVRLSLAHAKKTAPKVEKRKDRLFDPCYFSEPEFSATENKLLQVIMDMEGLKASIMYVGRPEFIPRRFRWISYEAAIREREALIPIMHKLSQQITDDARRSLVTEKAKQLSLLEAEVTSGSIFGIFQ